MYCCTHTCAAIRLSGWMNHVELGRSVASRAMGEERAVETYSVGESRLGGCRIALYEGMKIRSGLRIFKGMLY